MTLKPPRFQLFLAALVIGSAGAAAKFGYIDLLAPLSFWLVLAGFLILVFAVTFRFDDA